VRRLAALRKNGLAVPRRRIHRDMLFVRNGIVKFYVGLHQPSDAWRFILACISINRLRKRKKPITCADVLVDSGAFTELFLYGQYRHGVEAYAVVAELERLFNGPVPFHVMPVLQGFAPQDYVNHIRMYGDRLKPGMWVGVGSVCKRQGDPRAIVSVLQAISMERPDLLLHGFGVKKTALMHAGVRELLATADSMAWSYHARKNGRSANDWREAEAFAAAVNESASSAPQPWQMEMFA
jgi:hypothetical protein